ncbi:MAG: hypothetical protein LBL43_06640 [Treponema sp.]|jgi:hypothetical protein|nr:hypothetical protein [Treponema sp.]
MVSLLRTLPPVLRARDFHLYLEGGKRITDLWLEGGRAVLGRKPPGILRELKNAAERGLFSPFPHPLEGRLSKALSKLFPGFVFRTYYVNSPVFETGGSSGALPQPRIWRPFLEPEENSPLPPLLLPLLPVPWGLTILALKPELEGTLPPPDMVPPLLLAPAVRGIYDLIAAAPLRGRLHYPRIERALAEPACPWERRGIYLFFKSAGASADVPAERPGEGAPWEALFRRFLDGGFLLPPRPEEPVILPGIMSDGEEAKLAGLLGQV